jgi:hypothetical protein
MTHGSRMMRKARLMRQQTEAHRHGGWTRLEIVVVMLVIIFTVAMVVGPAHSYGSGTFVLRISCPGGQPSSADVRHALIRRDFANLLLVHHPHPEMNWEPLAEEASVEHVVSFSVHSKRYLWGGANDEGDNDR